MSEADAVQTSIAPVQSIFSQLGWNGLTHSDRGSLDLRLCFFSIILFNLTFIYVSFIHFFFLNSSKQLSSPTKHDREFKK